MPDGDRGKGKGERGKRKEERGKRKEERGSAFADRLSEQEAATADRKGARTFKIRTVVVELPSAG